jgi:hypothetical protein
MRRIWSKLTYANVMSTIAVVLAVGGGATAIAMTALPKNSVKSKQIAKGAVTTKKIAKDAVTGDQVKESTLGKVPSAAHAYSADSAATAASAGSAASADAIGGIHASELTKVSAKTGAFNEFFELNVPSWGSFGLFCIQNSPNNEDDELQLYVASSPGANGSIESGTTTSQVSPGDAANVTALSGISESSGAASYYGNQNHILSAQFKLTAPGGSRSLLIEAAGFDDHATPGCEGQVTAYTVG